MPRKVGLKRSAIPVPQNLDEAAEFLHQIGEEQRTIDGIQTALNTQVEELKSRAMADINPHEEKISQLLEGLFAFAASHRDELTENGKRKTIELPTGSFGWRMTPPAISIRNLKSALAKIKQLGLTRFIRIKETLDKKAMLQEPEIATAIDGVSIKQREEFVVRPSELEVEIVSRADKLKKAVSS